MKRKYFAKKLGMTQYNDDKGEVTPITVIQLLDQEPVLFKTVEKDGYNAVIYSYLNVKETKLSKPLREFYKKNNVKPKKFISELRLDDNLTLTDDNLSDFNVCIDQLKINDLVSVRAKTKGKGFKGTIYAHNFARGPMSHGSKNHRLPGSIGAGTDPARVFKGTKMAKRVGNKYVTKKNLKVIFIDNENNILYLKGSVPGNNNEILTISNWWRIKWNLQFLIIKKIKLL